MSVATDDRLSGLSRCGIRAIALAAVGAVLGWLVVTHSLAAYLATAAPELVVMTTPRSAALQSAAESELASLRKALARHQPDRRLTPEQSAALARITSYSALALARDPLSARAVRMLGEAAQLGGDDRMAARLMEEAARRSIREPVAVVHWMQESLRSGRLAETLAAAEIVLATEPNLAQLGIEAMVRLAETEAGRPLLIRRLLEDPPWRTLLLVGMTSYITDARTPLQILMALDDAGKPPQGRELTDYLSFLIGRGFHDIAHYAWLRHLPQEELARAGFLFNGDFGRRPSGSPMDWVLKNGHGADVAIVPHGANPQDMALRVELGPGRVQFGEVRQRLLLAAGNYVLSGQTRGVLNGRRGLRWQIACADREPRTVAETVMTLGTSNAWRELEAGFTIPELDCRSQILRLVHDARHTAEQFVTGVIWYDNLKITRR